MVADMINMQRATVMLLCMLSGTAWGYALPDPTRPPAEIGGGDGMVASPQLPPAKGLMSVIISPTRCAAIIDGKTFNLGEQYDGSKLVRISASGVVLQGPKGLRTMALFPGVGVKINSVEMSPRKPISCGVVRDK